MPAVMEPAAIHHSPPLFAVRAVPGHEEDEALLKRTDLPAMGRATRLWRKGTKLLADFDDVPEIVAKLIEQRAYTRVSAEFYEDFTAGGKLYGPVLRRVAMLGAEIPEVKTLADIPTPANGSLRGVEIFDTGIHKGTEYTPSFLDQVVANFDLLSRDAELTAAKFSEATFRVTRFFMETPSMSAHLLAALKAARKLPKKFSEKITSDAHKATWKRFDEMPVEGAPPPEGAPAAVTREDMMGLLGQMGMDPAVLEKLDDEALAEVVRVLKSQSAPVPAPEPTAAMSAAPPAVTPPAAPTSGIPGVPNAHPSQVTLKFSEKGEPLNLPEYLAAIVPAAVAAAIKPIHDQLSATAGHVSKFAESQKKAQIDSDLALLVKEGKVLPAEVEGLRGQLMRADGVAKFSDGLTELDKQLALLKARPNLVKFSEVVKTGKGGTTNANANVEKQKVVAFSESAKMQPVLKAAGKSPEKYVEEFEAAQKKRPGMTAKDFGVSEEYAA